MGASGGQLRNFALSRGKGPTSLRLAAARQMQSVAITSAADCNQCTEKIASRISRSFSTVVLRFWAKRRNTP